MHLSEHFTLGEVTKSSHQEVYNIPSHVAIENLKRVCTWLEELRRRYNELYVFPSFRPPRPSGSPPNSGGEEVTEEPIIINSGYRSPELNKIVGGVPTSNHLTGCAVDIRVTGFEQAKRYRDILIEYANETKQDYDELLIERNKSGSYWLHFAVRPKGNRRKTRDIIICKSSPS